MEGDRGASPRRPVPDPGERGEEIRGSVARERGRRDPRSGAPRNRGSLSPDPASGADLSSGARPLERGAPSVPSRKKWKRVLLGVLGAAVLLVGAKKTRYYVFWDNFAEVEPGVLYRSAHQHSYQLRSAVKRYGLRAILNLGHHNEADEEEERVVQDLGVRYLKANWPGNGVVSEDALRWAYDLVSDPSNQPILVHCARGTHRTGVTVAYWRILRSSWSREQIRD